MLASLCSTLSDDGSSDVGVVRATGTGGVVSVGEDEDEERFAGMGAGRSVRGGVGVVRFGGAGREVRGGVGVDRLFTGGRSARGGVGVDRLFTGGRSARGGVGVDRFVGTGAVFSVGVVVSAGTNSGVVVSVGVMTVVELGELVSSRIMEFTSDETPFLAPFLSKLFPFDLLP